MVWWLFVLFVDRIDTQWCDSLDSVIYCFFCLLYLVKKLKNQVYVRCLLKLEPFFWKTLIQFFLLAHVSKMLWWFFVLFCRLHRHTVV